MTRIQSKIAAAALLLAPACTPVDEGLGNAVRQNIAAQVIDPDPQYRGTVMEAGSGDRAALAIERYREGRVIPPRETDGTDSFGFGSNGGVGAGNGAGGTPPK